MSAFELVVFGTPAPAGSKRVVPLGGKARGKSIVIDASKRSRPWKDLISQEAGKMMTGRALLQGPLEVVFTFCVRRPKGHYGKRGLLPSAPACPTVKPDLLKLARAVEDALTGIVYRDDAQIVHETLGKEYAEPECVRMRVAPIELVPWPPLLHTAEVAA